MKQRCGMICMLLASAMLLGACANPTTPDDPGEDPPIVNPDDPDDPIETPTEYTFRGTVEDCFGGALEGATVKLGEKTATADESGAFTVTETERSEELSVELAGYQPQTVDLSGYSESESAITLDTVYLAREFAPVSSLQETAWEESEAFTLSVTRDRDTLYLRADSSNRVFTSSDRDSTLEFYVSVGEVAESRDANVTKITVKSSGTVGTLNYGGADLGAYTVGADIAPNGEGLSVTVALPFAMLRCENDEIVGLAMGLYSDTDGARADLLTLGGEGTVDIFTPSTYVRADKDNNFFTSPKNMRPEDINEIDRDALTAGYSLRFSVPELSNRASVADDFYLKAEKESDGFLVSMIGFGDFADEEYVKLIFHTSETDGNGWAVQASDLNVLVNKSKAAYKTGLTRFWSNDGGYSSFTSQDTLLANAPVYTVYDGYFTLTLKVLYTEIPAYSAEGKVSLFAMEFVDNGTTNGLIYDAANYVNGMLVDGISQGDPAAQSSYFVIQGAQADEIDPALIEGFGMEFSIGADHIYAKSERGATSVTFTFRSFNAFDDTDFIRIILHTGEPIGSNAYALSRSDVSFTVYKDAAYWQTDKISFYEGASGQFHGYDTTYHAPVYTEGDGYWTLTLEIEYIELDEVTASTELRAFLGEYVSGVSQTGAKSDGVLLGDQAYQANWFII